MKQIYIDNFRGFTDTFIPFLNVNFMVGENSTGKTSILNLINLIQSSSFWMYPDFNNDEVTMGHFHEIVNKKHKDKKYFDIGVEQSSHNEKGFFKYIWLRFGEHNNIPRVKSCAVYKNEKTYFIRADETSISGKAHKQADIPFADWINEVRSNHDGEYKNLINAHFNNKIPFEVMVQVIIEKLSKSNSSKSDSSVIAFPFINSFMWFAPIRAKARRIYDMYRAHYSADGEHMPILLQSILLSEDKPKELIQSLFKFGKASNLFDEIRISKLGKSKGSPFSINILYKKIPMGITNVGYGISQILPIIVQILTRKHTTFAIQQPEVHLHPKAQAAFGDFVYQSAKLSKNNFIIETHSDYTINRYRYNIFANPGKASPPSQIIFFERFGTETRAIALPFKPNGAYSDDTPESYGKFFIDEELKLLEF